MIQKIKKSRPAEIEIVNSVLSLLNDCGYLLQFQEVQFCEKYIDIICKNGFEESIAVEAKVSSPSKAFKQASLYLHVADYVYVALLKNKTNKKSLELSSQTGIGLILVEQLGYLSFKASIVVKADKSKFKNNFLSRHILDLKTKSKEEYYNVKP